MPEFWLISKLSNMFNQRYISLNYRNYCSIRDVTSNLMMTQCKSMWKKFKKESSLCTVSTHWCCNYRNYQGQLTSQHQKDAFFNVVVILMCDGLMFFSEKNCKHLQSLKSIRFLNSQIIFRVHFDIKEFCSHFWPQKLRHSDD